MFIRGANRPFGELTPDDARSRADELRAAVGWGPTARVAPVAQAWRELSIALDRAGAATVGALDPDVLVKLAPRLWVTLPVEASPPPARRPSHPLRARMIAAPACSCTRWVSRISMSTNPGARERVSNSPR